MPAHLLEPAIINTILANQDRINRGLHIIVDAPRAGTAEEGKRPVMGIEHHLQRLTRIRPHKWHSAMTEAHMGNLDRCGRTINQDDFVAPVELIGFAGVKTQRYISIC